MLAKYMQMIMHDAEEQDTAKIQCLNLEAYKVLLPVCVCVCVDSPVIVLL